MTRCLFWAIGLLLSVSQLAQAQVSGTVFRDVNGDGIQSTTYLNEPGVSGLTVVATKTDGTTVTAITSSSGTYTFTVAQIPSTTKIRLDFLAPATDFDSPLAAGAGTSVQFVTAPSTTANLGLITTAGPNKFLNPCVVTSCFVAVNTPADPALIAFQTAEIQDLAQPFVNGTTANQFSRKAVMTKTTLATQAQVGTINGLTFHNASNTVLAAAFVRNAGRMPGGSGAIYKIVNPSGTPVVSLLTTIPNTGSLTATTAVGTEALTGYAGLGDLALSTDQNTLYTVNLFTKQLVTIPLSGSSLTAGTPTTQAIPIPVVAGTTAADFHPLGLGMKNGKLYVAMTCGKLGSQAGYIYEYDEAAFTLKLTIPFNYTRSYRNANYYGYSGYPKYIDNNNNYIDWNATLVTNYLTDFDAAQDNPKFQPWVSDIEFDGNDMIIGVRSRLADARNNSFWVIGGDILRACSTDGVSWTLENNGTCGTKTTAPIPAIDPYTKREYTGTFGGFSLNTNFGPGGSEYYWGDDGFEGEASQGSLLMIPGYTDVLVSQIDAIGHTGQVGVMALSNTKGSITSAGNVFFGEYNTGNNISKSNGLGALTFFPNPATVEIGNRVWKDDNRNGIQDPAELGIATVTVGLYQSTSLVATAVTNAAGEYYFSSATGTNTTNAKYNLNIVSGATYQLRILTTQSAVSAFTPTLTNAGSNTAIDSDFSVSGTNVVADFVASDQNNHTFDAGFIVCPTIAFASPAANTLFCGSTTATIGITTNAVAPDQIQLVAFTEALASPADAYTSTDGIDLGTVASTTATGNKTLTLNVTLPDNLDVANQNLYVYAILVSADGQCQPVANRNFIIKPRPTVGASGNPILCQGTTAVLTASGPAGTTFQWFRDNATTVASTANPYTTPAISTTTTYRVRGTLAGCVSDDALITLTPVLCTPCTNSPTTVGGVVFRDFNSDGTNGTNDVNVSGVTVTIFRCDAMNQSTQVSTLQTDINGSYSFTGLTAGVDYRVEFSNLPTGSEPTFRGTNNGTTVQFTKPGSCTTNLGINLPGDYCQANPFIVVPCYQNGLRTNNTQPALVAFPYNASGNIGPETTNATISAVGATWGTDYQAAKKRLFAGAFLKRHVDLGSQGVGGLYVLDYTNSATAPAISSFDLQGVTPATGPAIDLGNISRMVSTSGLAAANFQLSATASAPNIDLDAYMKIGKTSLGDVDLDQTGNTLWTVNLNQRSLIKVDVSGATLPGTINHYALATLPGYPTAATYTNTGTTTLRINAGGAAFTDANGNAWVADQNFTGGTTLSTANTITNVGNPYESTNSTASLYQSVRAGSSFSYAIPVVSGRYRVVMHLSDFTSTTSGQRATTTTAETFTAISGIDLRVSRADVANRATTSQFVVDVTDGTLNVGFTGGGTSNEARVAGIEVIPILSGPSGVMRPWGLGFRNGKGYLGVVSDASNSLQRADLQAYVLEFDPANVAAGFATTLSFPLNFTRENTNGGNLPGQWTAWRSEITMQGDVRDPSYRQQAPQPLLSDIDFSENGSMEIGFLDRTGNQEGFSNNRPFAGTTLLNGSGPRTAGDILHACFINGGFVLEQGNNGGLCKSNDTGGTNQLTNDGPANAGEFYNDDFFEASGGNHLEIATGGLLQRKGSGEVLSTVYDPTTVATNGGIFTQGVHWYNNQTGVKTDAFLVVDWNGSYEPTNFGKATGLGDPSLRCDPAPIQIGNRVWRDDNRNGIQDPCEPPIVGAVVKLYDAAKTTVLASVTTNAAGEYYFSSTTLTAGISTSSVATTALTPNTTFGLAITSLGTGTAVTGLTLTDVSPVTPGESGTLNSGLTINNNDAKVDVVGGIASPCIKLTTGGPGSTNHTYDFGIVKFICSLTATASASSQSICAGQPVTLRAQATPAGSYTYAWSGPASVSITPTNAATVTATNLATGVNTFTVTVSSSPGCSTTATVSVLVNPLPVLSVQTICAPNAQTYSIVGTVSPASATITDLGRTVVRNADSFTIAGILTAVSDVIRAETAEGCVTSLTVTPPICQPVCTLPTGLSVTTTCAAALDGSGQLVATTTSLSGTVEYRLNGVGSFGPSGTFTNLLNGTYTVEARLVGSTAPNCLASTTAVISCVCVPPSVTAQPSSASLTPGQSVTLTAQATPVGSYTYAWSGPGTITPTNASAVTASGLSNGVNMFTVTVTSSPGCFTTATVSVTVLTPALSVSVGTPVCNTLTNNYTASGTVSLTNAQAGSLTITDNGTTIATIPITTGQTSATFQATGVSGSSPASHSVVASLGTTTASTTYATPASCTVCSLSLTTTALNNGQVGTAYSQTLTTTGGTAPLSFSLTGSLPTGLTLDATTGVISGTPTSATTASFSVRVSDGKACTAVAPLTITVGNAPVCSLTATVTPGVCNTTTNQYTVTGTISATNTTGNQSLTVAVGSNSILVALNGNGPASFTLSGLESDGLLKTLTVISSATACGTTSQTFTAPASCTIGLALSVTPGVCNTLTNGYDITGTLSLTNAQAGTATISDGTSSTTVTVNAGDTSVPYSLTGLPSGSGNRIVTVNYAGKVASVTYTAPESCTVAPVLALTVTPGVCNTVTNQYSVAGTISLTAAVASTLTISDGAISTTVSVTAGQVSAIFSLTGLTSGTGEHIVTVSGTGYTPASATYNAPESCTVAPALSVAVTPGTCNTATNQYDLTGTVSFTAAVASTLIISDGASTTTISVTAGQTSVSFSLTGLESGSGNHIVTVSGTGYNPASTTYAAPESCTVCSLSLTTASLPNGQVGTAYSQTLTTTGGTTPLTFAVAGGSLPAGLGLNTATGIISGTPTSAATSSFSVLVTDSKSCSALVPLTITVANEPVCSLTATVTPGVCNTLTNQYTVTGTISATNTPANQSLTVSVSSEASTVVTLTGDGPANFTLTGLESDGLLKTLTVTSSATACGMASVTYTAPASCTVAPPLASLGDKVFQDNNGNGLQDPNIDTPLPNVTVTLISNGTVVATTTTASSGTGIGCYSFTGLTPGVPYSVSFTTPVGFSATTPLVGNDRAIDSDPVNGITAPVTLTAGENNITIDAGFVPAPVPTGSIGDFVWKDNNNNGQFDTNEPPVPGVQVELFSVSGGVTSTSALQTTVTNGNGQYTFANLPSGDYTVKFTVPASLTDACQLTTKPLSGTDRSRDSDADPVTGFSPVVTINASGTGIAKDNPTIDAGLQRRIYDPVGYIYCYKDGTILKGGTISVTGPGSVSITEDGSQGYYQFFTDGTPGSYTLSYNNPNAFGIATDVRPPAGPFISPTGLEGTPADKDGILNGWVSLGSGPNSTTTALTDASAAANPYYLVFDVMGGDPYVSENNLPIECTPPTGSLGDFVFNDLNKDGRQDSGEPGVNGVTVRLLEQTSPGNFTMVSTTITTGNGAYLFPNLPGGTYVVEFDKTTLPASLTFTTPNAPGVPTDKDSDAIPTAGNPMVARSAPVTLVPTDPIRRNDLTIDAGLFDTTCPPTTCVPIVIQQIRGPRR